MLYKPTLKNSKNQMLEIISMDICAITFKYTNCQLYNPAHVFHANIKKSDIAQQYIDTSAMSCCVISQFLYLLFF